MATTADFRNGLCIIHNNGIYSIVEFQHVKPGKGPAFVRTKLKNIKTGKVLDNTFTAGHKVETARIERRPHQYLYKDDLGYNCMNSETFDQIAVAEHLIDAPEFLKDGEVIRRKANIFDPARVVFQYLGCEQFAGIGIGGNLIPPPGVEGLE